MGSKAATDTRRFFGSVVATSARFLGRLSVAAVQASGLGAGAVLIPVYPAFVFFPKICFLSKKRRGWLCAGLVLSQ